MAIVKDTKDQSYWTYRLSTEQTITGDSIGELPINNGFAVCHDKRIP